MKTAREYADWFLRDLCHLEACQIDDEMLTVTFENAIREARAEAIWEAYRAMKRAFVIKGDDGRYVTDVGPSQMVRLKGAVRELLDLPVFSELLPGEVK